MAHMCSARGLGGTGESELFIPSRYHGCTGQWELFAPSRGYIGEGAWGVGVGVGELGVSGWEKTIWQLSFATSIIFVPVIMCIKARRERLGLSRRECGSDAVRGRRS